MLDGTGDGSAGWGSRLGSCEPPPHGLECSRWHFLFPRGSPLSPGVTVGPPCSLERPVPYSPVRLSWDVRGFGFGSREMRNQQGLKPRWKRGNLSRDSFLVSADAWFLFLLFIQYLHGPHLVSSELLRRLALKTRGTVRCKPMDTGYKNQET